MIRSRAGSFTCYPSPCGDDGIGSGFVLRLFPKLIWNLEALETERFYIPQLLCGLFCLVALLCWYVLQQRRSLKNTQKQLISELIRRENSGAAGGD